MSILEIKEGETVLARYIPAQSAWREGLSFFSDDADFIQVGSWGYDTGKELLAHQHNVVIREALWTQEVIFVRQGSLLAKVYGTQQNKVAELTV